MSPGARIGRVFEAAANVVLALACVALVAMALVEAWQVFARYVLNDSPGWTEPVAVLLMNTAMMFGAATAVRREAHFGFFILVHSAPLLWRRVLLATARLIAAGSGFVLAVWGMKLVTGDWDVPMAGASLPQGIAFLPITAGGALIALFALERLFSGADVVTPAEH